MAKTDVLRPKMKKVSQALEKAYDALTDLAADALFVEPGLTSQLGAVGKRIYEANVEFDRILDDLV